MLKLREPVYFISGLGIDERALARIRLPENYEAKFIRWIEPEKRESLAAYSRRLLEQITEKEPVILAGLSFGGVIAAEIGKHISVKRTILLSSIALSSELPRYYRWLIAIKLHRIIPAALLKRSNFITYWLFGTRTKEEKQVLKAVMRDMSSVFLRWAMEAIIKWKNEQAPPVYTRIHGTKDKVLYFPTGMPCEAVKDAGHFMVFPHAGEVSRLLEETLNA